MMELMKCSTFHMMEKDVFAFVVVTVVAVVVAVVVVRVIIVLWFFFDNIAVGSS